MSGQIKIIGLSGMNGSGKDTIAQLLAEKYCYYNAIATDMLRDELESRGLPTDRNHKSKLSAEWRRQYGMAVIVDRAYSYYLDNQDKYNGIIVGSLRHPSEADKIHELGGQMLWVDGNPLIRYHRIQSNLEARGTRLEDLQTFEEWQADEEREMHPEGDEATLNGAAVKERADIFLINDGKDIEAFKAQAEKVLDL